MNENYSKKAHRWADDYGHDFSFEKCRTEFFPEYPHSIFYTRRFESRTADNEWCGSLNSFAIRTKVFLISGKIALRDRSEIIQLSSGEYYEVTGGGDSIKYLRPSKGFFVVERPPGFSKSLQKE